MEIRSCENNVYARMRRILKAVEDYIDIRFRSFQREHAPSTTQLGISRPTERFTSSTPESSRNLSVLDCGCVDNAGSPLTYLLGNNNRAFLRSLRRASQISSSHK